MYMDESLDALQMLQGKRGGAPAPQILPSSQSGRDSCLHPPLEPPASGAGGRS